ncbi:MAG: GIY-YIG nuclease family protein [Pseudolabrys sp.]
MGSYVYMQRCADDSLYVGSATGSDLNTRIAEHDSGVRPGYTQSRRPFGWSGRSILIG